MFSAKLGNLNYRITSIHYLLGDPNNFMSKHQCCGAFRLKITQIHAAFSLLDSDHLITLLLQGLHTIQRVFHVRPIHAVRRTERSLLHIRRTGGRSQATQINVRGAKTIGRAEQTPHIVEAAHVVGDNDQGCFFRIFKIFGR